MTVMRSMLFLPATRPELVAKAIARRPDLAVLDLEDAVAEQHKDAARDLLAAATAQLADSDVIGLVRINAPGSDQFYRDLAAVAESSAAGLVLPKYEDCAVIDEVRVAIGPQRILIVGIESMAGVAGCRALLRHDITAAYFGAEDYIADLGGRRTEAGDEVLYARSEVVLAGRLAGIATIDQAVVHVRDDARFRADAVRGRALGYRGKICLNPRQVELAHEVFTPSEQELADARALLVAGRSGVAVLGDQMIDDVHVRAAEALLARDPRESGAGATGSDTPH